MAVKYETIRERLLKEADSLAANAETEKKLSLLSESNAVRKRSGEYSGYIEEGKRKIAKLECKLKALV